jgi:hypothetical protein
MDNPDKPTTPLQANVPHTALVFLCPSCECALEYEGTRASGAGAQPADLSDYFRCPAGCGTFEHERRTHRMRLVEPGEGQPNA